MCTSNRRRVAPCICAHVKVRKNPDFICRIRATTLWHHHKRPDDTSTFIPIERRAGKTNTAFTAQQTLIRACVCAKRTGKLLFYCHHGAEPYMYNMYMCDSRAGIYSLSVGWLMDVMCLQTHIIVVLLCFCLCTKGVYVCGYGVRCRIIKVIFMTSAVLLLGHV